MLMKIRGSLDGPNGFVGGRVGVGLILLYV